MLIRELRRKVSFFVREFRNAYFRIQGVKVGKNVFISSGAWIDTQDGQVIIEDGVRITNGCKILSHDYSPHFMGRPAKKLTTTIKRASFIGMNVVILPGVTIGEGSVIGAGCVISEDIPDYSLVVSSQKPNIIKRKNIITNKWEKILN